MGPWLPIVLELIRVLAVALGKWPAIRADYESLLDSQKGLIESGRDPTPTEFADMQIKIDALHARIQAARASEGDGDG